MTNKQKRYLTARRKYMASVGKGPTIMPYRPGDPTVDVEARIEVSTAKAYLIEPTMGKKSEVWLPKSQVVGMTEPDDNGNRVFTVTEWWYNKAELNDN